MLAGWQRVEDASKAPAGAVVVALADDGWSLIDNQASVMPPEQTSWDAEFRQPDEEQHVRPAVEMGVNLR